MQTQPVEDIDAVLGRFQAWAGARNAVEAKPGVRELSHEEALRSSRYRWKGADQIPAKKKLGPEPGVVAVAPPEPQPQRLKDSGKGRDKKRRAAKKVRARIDAVSKRSDVKDTAPLQAPRKTVERREFREVLAEAIRPAEVVVAAQPVELTRQVGISMRLAPAERALIKTRAAEAGISTSAYMRQCVVEVEQLRAQVQQAIAAMEGKTPAQLQAPVQPTGLLARIARRFFSGSAQTVALRA